MSSAGTGGCAPTGGSSIPPGRHAPGTALTANPTFDQVVTFLDWFGHPDNDVHNGVSPKNLPANLNNCNPAAAMATLVSREPMVPLAFLRLSQVPAPCTDSQVSSSFLALVLVSLTRHLPSKMGCVPVLIRSQEDQVPLLVFLTWISTLMMMPP